jgi:hypothetical protein
VIGSPNGNPPEFGGRPCLGHEAHRRASACPVGSAQRSEEGAEVFDEQCWLFGRGETTPAGHLGPVADVGVALLAPPAHWRDDLFGEYSDAGGNGDGGERRPGVGEQLTMAARLHDPPVFDDVDHVGGHDRREAAGDSEGRTASDEIAERGLDPPLRYRIEASSGGALRRQPPPVMRSSSSVDPGQSSVESAGHAEQTRLHGDVNGLDWLRVCQCARGAVHVEMGHDQLIGDRNELIVEVFIDAQRSR